MHRKYLYQFESIYFKRRRKKMKQKIFILMILALTVISAGCISAPPQTQPPGTTVTTTKGETTSSTIIPGVTTTRPSQTPPPEETSTVTIRVTDTNGNPLNGIVAFEKGFVHKNRFILGALVENGVATVTLPKLRDIPELEWNFWGVHVYASNYIYFPKEIEIIPGEDYEFDIPLPVDQNPENDPIINDIKIDSTGGTTKLTMDVKSPQNNLGPQILAINSRTQEALVFKPPTPVQSLSDNFPNGEYSAQTDQATLDPKEWYFVVADHGCSNGPIQGYPVNENIISALPEGSTPIETQPPEGSIIEVGSQLVSTYGCTGCHHFNSASTFDEKDARTNWLVGPGLRDVFQNDLLPASGRPATEANVRKQIREGSSGMPAFDRLTEEEVSSIIAYLKSL